MTQADFDFIIHALVTLFSALIGFYGGIIAIHYHKKKTQDAEFRQININTMKKQAGQTRAPAPPLQQQGTVTP